MKREVRVIDIYQTLARMFGSGGSACRQADDAIVLISAGQLVTHLLYQKLKSVPPSTVYIKVLVADDTALMRKAICTLL
jgi:hypothetical protein